MLEYLCWAICRFVHYLHSQFDLQTPHHQQNVLHGSMMAVSAPDLPNDEQAWSRLLAGHQNTRIQAGRADGGIEDVKDTHHRIPMVQSSVLIKVDSAPGPTTTEAAGKDATSTLPEGNIGGLGGVGLTGVGSTSAHMGERKPSFIDSFNRQLRSSFRAVSDSPGAIQR